MQHQTQARRSRSNVSSQHSFAQVPSVQNPRSAFDRSCGLKTTFDSGYLVPVFLDEALPGDTMSMHMTSFARMATPLHPIMDNLKMEVFFFAVPIRLIWANWAKFNGEKMGPNDTSEYVIPQTTPGATGQDPGTLWDYFGLPVGTGADEPSVCAFWHRAYNLIWNEWFRDENLQDMLAVITNDGPDDQAFYTLKKRGKRHDYFTSSLPWPQKGPAVTLPLGLNAPVIPLLSADVGEIPAQPAFHHLEENPSGHRLTGTIASDNAEWVGNWPVTGNEAYWQNTGLETDLANASGATINALREAFQIQKLYERDARGGTRYTEIIRSHFGVSSPDARLQRPEYLGGGSSQISINPVAQTSGTITAGVDPTAQGNLAAFVTSANTFPHWVKSFTEHCVILGLVSVRADLNYQRNVPRMFSRTTRWDFYWPALSHLGEQAVLNKEIYYDAGDIDPDTGNDAVWGYQERWAEYRYKPSTLTGKMRSDVDGETSGSLDTWHLAQDYGTTRPMLNSDFIEENPPVERVLAVLNEPQFLLDCFFKYRCARPMPTYSVPGLIDHF